MAPVMGNIGAGQICDGKEIECSVHFSNERLTSIRGITQ